MWEWKKLDNNIKYTHEHIQTTYVQLSELDLIFIKVNCQNAFSVFIIMQKNTNN